MTISEVLARTWKALKDEDFTLQGYYERRILPASKFALFAGLLRPSDLPTVSIEVPVALASHIAEEKARGFRLRTELCSSIGIARLRLELTSAHYGDIFLIVCADILSRLLESQDEQTAVETLWHRLKHWRRFMESSGPSGLSRQEQIGLFGELSVLRTMLSLCKRMDSTLVAWRGPSGANQDFIASNRAVEVKTTATNELTRVRISNEHQLDTHGFATLILCHVRVDERTGAGTTLPQLVEAVRDMLDPHYASSFLDGLLEAGYHESQSHFYMDHGFFERERNYYEVTGDFPRIVPADLRIGVSEVEYQIDLSAVAVLKLDESQAIAQFFGADL